MAGVLKGWIGPVLWGLGVGWGYGQTAPANPTQGAPVRRAEAVASPTPAYPSDPAQIENPAWMNRVPRAQAVEGNNSTGRSVEQTTSTGRSVEGSSPAPYRPPGSPPPPVLTEEPTPRPIPAPTAEIPTARAVPAAALQPTPAATPSAPVQAPTPTVPVVTRPATTPGSTPAATPTATPTPVATPSSPDQTLEPSAGEGLDRPRRIQTAKDFGDAFFARRMWDLAVPEYEKYLEENRTATDRPAAFFRLAESYRNLQKAKEAQSVYERLLRETRKGEFAGAAAYRLGTVLLEQNQAARAAGMFEVAATEANDAAIRLSASFFAARAAEMANENRRAFRLYEAVLKQPEADLKYQEASLAGMARLSAAMSRTQEAIELYQRLADTTENPKLKSESMLKAANLLLAANKPEEARSLLASLAEKSDSPEVAAAARFGLLELDYQGGQYEKITGLNEEQIQALPPELRSRAYLLAANSHRERNQFPEALRLYDRIVRDFAGSPSEGEAQFNRLVCLFRMDDPTLLPALNRFLLEARDPKEIAQARMLKAETHFQAGDFADAAATYGALMSSNLPPALLADASYKHAWCLARIGQHNQSTIAYSEFINRFPKDGQIPAALLGRALSHQSSGAPDAALRDFDQVLQEYPQSGEREVALLQRGLLHGAQRNYAKMREDFSALLKEFPESKARAQAEFWIGYAYFEEKDYEASLAHFAKARELDAETYGARANLRLLLANYYLERPAETAREIEEHDIPNVPAEVYQWLAAKFLETGDQPAAEKYLRIILSGKAGNAPTPEFYLQLAQNLILQKKYGEALDPIRQYLDVIKDPPSRARAFLVQGEAFLGQKDTVAAQKAIEDALLLQPEGRVNAEARLLSARLEEAKGQPAEAARIYMTVAVLYDDETLTPQALRAARDAYKKAGDAAGQRKAEEELQLRYPNSTSAAP